MANNIYDRARYSLATGDFDWLTMDLVLSVWSGTPDFVATDHTIADLTSRGNIELGASLPITLTDVTPDGTTQTNQVVVPTTEVGPVATWFTMAEKGVTHTASDLILFIDTAEGLPFTTNGLDIVVQPDFITQRGWFRA